MSDGNDELRKMKSQLVELEKVCVVYSVGVGGKEGRGGRGGGGRGERVDTRDAKLHMYCITKGDVHVLARCSVADKAEVRQEL